MRIVIHLLIGFLFSVTFIPVVAFGQTSTALFAGGCFWCMEADFDKVPGVIQTISGYTGGATKNPSYEAVSKGGTGHFEAVSVVYDPTKVSYQALLNVFWHSIDPTDANGQFCDKGDSYRSAIFYQNKEQENRAKQSKAALLKSGQFKTIATEILPASVFYPAEEYHQNYYQKNPVRYRYYRHRCGRDARIKEVWGG